MSGILKNFVRILETSSKTVTTIFGDLLNGAWILLCKNIVSPGAYVVNRELGGVPINTEYRAGHPTKTGWGWSRALPLVIRYQFRNQKYGINLAEIIDSLDGIGIADCLKKAKLPLH